MTVLGEIDDEVFKFLDIKPPSYGHGVTSCFGQKKTSVSVADPHSKQRFLKYQKFYIWVIKGHLYALYSYVNAIRKSAVRNCDNLFDIFKVYAHLKAIAL
jgi:hypothetical protein